MGVRIAVAPHSYAASYAEQTAWFNSDFYGVLGVPSGVDSSQLKKVYRKLARSFHPDKYDSSGPEFKILFKGRSRSAFLEISAAYEILKDAKKRKEYDEFITSLPARFGRYMGKAA